MFLKAKPLFIEVKTPLHVGSGSELGVIDLPVQRERTTGYPKIDGSSLKGAMREKFESTKSKMLDEWKCAKLTDVLFGPDNVDEGSNYKSMLSFTDAKVLLFPVRSARGVFVWITSKDVLRNFIDNMKIVGLNNGIGNEANNIEVGVSNKELLLGDKLLLEDYAMKLGEKEKVKDLAKALSDIVPLAESELSTRFAVLDDNDFKYFVMHTTEVMARTRINGDTGTVDEGALWYEEFVPERTIFYSIVLATKPFSTDCNEIFNKGDNTQKAIKALKIFGKWLQNNSVLQIGGDETIGKGICKISMQIDS